MFSHDFFHVELNARFNPLVLTHKKIDLIIQLIYIFGKCLFWEIFEGEIFIRTIPKSPLQMFDEFMLYSLVIHQSVIDPDDNLLK